MSGSCGGPRPRWELRLLAFSFAARLAKCAMPTDARVDHFETAPTVQHVGVQKALKLARFSSNNREQIVDGVCTHVRDEKPSL
jgi:hypothetical protein